MERGPEGEQTTLRARTVSVCHLRTRRLHAAACVLVVTGSQFELVAVDELHEATSIRHAQMRWSRGCEQRKRR